MLQRHSNHDASYLKKSGNDRRGASRYITGQTVVTLSWTEGEAVRSIAATLREISLGGGSALAESAPCPGTMAWFRLQGDDTSPWIAATIVATSKTGLLGRGPRLIRWRFPESCPYDIFKAAINGFSQSQEIDEVTMPGYTRRDWRG